MLERYVTPTEIRTAGRSRLISHVAKAGRLPRAHLERLADRALAAAQAQTVALPAEGVAAGIVRELAAEAWAARERIASLDAEIEAALSRHPDAALIRSLPGMGATLTAEFIAEAGGIERFPTADRLAAAAGLARSSSSRERCATCTGPREATRRSSASSSSRPSARWGTRSVAPSTRASAAKASATTRRCSPLLAAGSTCCTRCCETARPTR